MDASRGGRAKEDEKRLSRGRERKRERKRGRRDEISPCPDLL